MLKTALLTGRWTNKSKKNSSAAMLFKPLNYVKLCENIHAKVNLIIDFIDKNIQNRLTSASLL
jgi:hypothetical protein